MRAAVLFLSALFLFAQPAWASDTQKTSEEHTHEERYDKDGHDDEHTDHTASAHGVTALHAWIRATSEKEALLFVEINNGSDKDVKFLGAETEIADTVELVGFQLKNGEADYVALPVMPVKPGKELVLAPNGLALRLTGLKQDFEKGDSFKIELEFDVGHLDMTVQVEAENATQHSHAGHQH
ncbi:copper chaperone PCu(A)C [Roseibium sediminicola]|uniref:Copper chaperone PCu(A)C n=1 Tax=Roseibium sediminicola TaxID=2933272 RepID=A0ABT0GTP7_9HYPH|nr:copper chaperone PCu(A)C [Roseibium sp. CAU 1639]MCK7612814.1 copper chaperone PCu(A)C [Roseibium sp. CAU 1639]